MPALITLTADQQEQLKGLLNGLNRRLAHANFGDVFVSWLNGDKVKLTVHEQDVLRALLNRLNLKARKMRFGDLAIGLLDDATKKATIDALSAADIDQIRGLLNNLNLDIQEIELGQILGDIVAPPAAATTPAPGTTPGGNTGGSTGTGTGSGTGSTTTKSITAKAEQDGAKGGDVFQLVDMFDLVGITPAEIDFKVDPAAKGDVTAAGVLTLKDAATGTVTVEAKAKAAAGTVTGSGAKFSIKNITAKAPTKTLSAKSAKATATGGDPIAFTAMFDATNVTPAELDFKVNPTTAGAVDATGKLTLADAASGKVEVTATAKTSAGTVTGSPAKFTITQVTAKVVATPLAVAVTPAADQDKNVGDALDTLTAAATGGDGTYTYQWQLDGADVTGKTAATLDIASLASADEGAYTVIVTDGAAATATSNAVNVTVTAP
ncbi:hypothetical protein Q6670_004051 [Salmonella enterica]|nr:hypothetical protein [Salmonella enterica]